MDEEKAKFVESFGKLSSEKNNMTTAGTTAMEIDGDSGNTRFLLQEIIIALRGPNGRASSRAKALAITKLQEARFWLGEDMFGEQAEQQTGGNWNGPAPKITP